MPKVLQVLKIFKVPKVFKVLQVESLSSYIVIKKKACHSFGQAFFFVVQCGKSFFKAQLFAIYPTEAEGNGERGFVFLVRFEGFMK